MILPEKEVVDITKKTVFYSEPFLFHLDISKDLHVLQIQLGNLRVIAYVEDSDFSQNPKKSKGEIRITHDPSKATRKDMLKLGRVQIFFHFPEQEGRKESLVAYVPRNFLGELNGC